MQKPLPHSTSTVQLTPLFFVHDPSRPGNAHELPVPHEAEPQQTESTQVSPPLQTLESAQAVPSVSSATQAVALQ